MRRLSDGRIIWTAALLLVITSRTGWTAEIRRAEIQWAEIQRPLISRIPPNYPEIARRMHVAGTVVVELTAMPDGSVSGVHAISGHTLLMQAAEDCASHWRFMMMPKPEHGTVRVVFSLSE